MFVRLTLTLARAFLDLGFKAGDPCALRVLDLDVLQRSAELVERSEFVERSEVGASIESRWAETV